ncbi:His-Xaa-Ser system radical SAM maturase HxsC [Achromobacter sp. DH1f]|uniref:His-Xaa-Ser system radical SAM maturase HxsC n=1 Tax=Achromobacter sp. DH1f TaxID=1397275 RepID=UPI00046ABBA2|nr:His-Xaa-Ser system radical SAM maturase HxsC [Achromobacter sp. DH1f]
MRRLKANFGQTVQNGYRVWRVIDADLLAVQWQADLQFLVQAPTATQRSLVAQYQASGLSNVDWVAATGLEPGDIVSADPERSEVTVLYRESDVHHSLQLTNRCNSYCLMCSQPPTLQDDAWMVEETLDAIRHLTVSPQVLGLSGGEPLLLGPHLRTVLDSVGFQHPGTRVELLTNGRLLADLDQSHALLNGLSTPVTWLVPLYGHADFLHDFVVQTPGAFEQTLSGLLNLQRYSQPIQLRIVLIRPVLETLPALCTFIGRNLPFVKEVALMACEPIGFALANRELCEVDLLEWQESLQQASHQLARHSVPFLFMNAPLCALPRALHAYAHRSISDWKKVYAPACDACQMKSNCSGFFSWYERGWKPAKVIQIMNEEYVA